MDVLICGGGVIGASVAYFLSCRGVEPTVIESTGLACAASGKSGGFLARDWCDGTPLAPLSRRLKGMRSAARRRYCTYNAAGACRLDYPGLLT